MIYLDHAATSSLLPCAKNAILKAYNTTYGASTSLHSPGHAANILIEKSRAEIAHLINASPKEIIFTSGSTESNNTIIHTFVNKNIAISAIEHDSIIKPAQAYAKKISTLNTNQQGITSSEIPSDIDLVCVSMANSELGSINNIKKITKSAHDQSALVFSDITPVIGKVFIDIKSLNLDYASFSAHKLGGPVGIGVIYKKSSAPLQPLILGGGQENSFRSGTLPTALIAGFGAVSKYTTDHQTWEKYESDIRPLRDYLANFISSHIPYSRINTPLDQSLPNILNVSFPGAEGESIQLLLDAAGIAVSTGSACAAGKPSHVLSSIATPEIASSSIRFSLGLDTTQSDIDTVTSVLPDIVTKLRSISTINYKGDQNVR